jgi:Ca2+-binding RTX toxin-like protein
MRPDSFSVDVDASGPYGIATAQINGRLSITVSSARDLVITGTGSGGATVGSGAGDDRIDLSRALGSYTAYGNGGDDALFGGGGRDTLLGGNGNDRLDGDADNDSLEGGNGADRLYGGDGRDEVRGDLGADRLGGGAGRDVFRFDRLEDSGVGPAHRDVISDFSQQDGDRISLARIDAVPATAGVDDSFTFRGALPFTGPGQVRWFHEHGHTVVQASTDADPAPEFEIQLSGLRSLDGGDFAL